MVVCYLHISRRLLLFSLSLECFINIYIYIYLFSSLMNYSVEEVEVNKIVCHSGAA